MELRDIRYFAVVAEHLNIGRAADALNLSATALTKSLRRLEKSVGAKLVQRASKGVALTAVGTALLARILPLQGTLADVRREAADLARGHTGHIHAAANNAFAESTLVNACVVLSKEAPRISMRVTVAPDALLSAALRKGDIDFCVSYPGRFSPDEFVIERQLVVQDVVIASAQHRLAGRRQVTIGELAHERWAVKDSATSQQWQALRQVFESNALPRPEVALETNSQAVRLSAVAYSDYLGVATRQYLRQEARRYPLVELPVKETILVRSLLIIYRKDAYLSPAAKRLIEILRTQARETARGTKRLSRAPI
jgi:DNA-binding transcriptional LysR family regulator